MDFTSILLCCYFLLTPTVCTAPDVIRTTQSLGDGETLVSAGGIFKLGFFSTGSSNNRYLGIWFNKVPDITIVWVANREQPIIGSSGALKITDQGTLTIVDNNSDIIWSSKSTGYAINPVAQLLDSGNFVVKNEGHDNKEDYLWQSFHYPSDTLLPGMKLGRNRVTGLDATISSWKTLDDPAPGKFTFGFNDGGYPEMILTADSNRLYRTGPWNGLRFSGTPDLKSNPVYSSGFTFDEDEVSYKYEISNGSLPSRMVVDQNGMVQLFFWVGSWTTFLVLIRDQCDTYAICGPYGSCNIAIAPMCSCFEGFVPKFPKNWSLLDWSNGCVRKTPLNCSEDGFRKYSAVKLPETQQSWSNVAGFMKMDMSLEDCHFLCLRNCNCTAYSNLDVREGGIDCLLWFGDLIDIREYTDGGQDIFIRMAASELGLVQDNIVKHAAKTNVQKHIVIILSSVLSAGLLLLFLLTLILYRKRKRKTYRIINRMLERNTNDKGQKEDAELALFETDTMAQATNNFSLTNKLGEGGFGSVYKGILKDGREIAVKKLSKNSRQGLDEFKNEVRYIAKLQHRNLVKILGCCVQADEMMLVYEFMPNKSLDFFIFDQKQSTYLDWPTRCSIINGIARGLLYLHQDSRLRIIHRDLKAGNILLDCEMNPKISDFGLARSFGGNETEANTNKVVGTYGYMSPEYATDGVYSMKSDVFSFGVMVLEIVSGRRNRGFSHPEHHLNLLGHAWKLHKEGRTSELIAGSVTDSSYHCEALRSMKVGLLCVQRSTEDRPSMSNVVLMLGGEGELPEPKQPGFFTERDVIEESKSSLCDQKLCSPNGLTVSSLAAR